MAAAVVAPEACIPAQLQEVLGTRQLLLHHREIMADPLQAGRAMKGLAAAVELALSVAMV
jgi:hypothetical protein